MDRLSRRELLATASTLAAGALLPFRVMRDSLDDLDARIDVLDERAPALGPGLTAVRGRALLADARHPRHIGRLALVMSRTARWSDDHTGGLVWLTLASSAASEAGEGNLAARAMMARATLLGTEGMNRGVAAGPAVRGLLGAVAAQSGNDDKLHATALYRTSHELALTGEAAAARVALSRADHYAELGGMNPAVAAAWRSTTLLHLSELDEAKQSALDGMGAHESVRLTAICDLARVCIAQRDHDEAAGYVTLASNEAGTLNRGDIIRRLRSIR